MNYLVLNKASDYQSGQMDNLHFDKGELCLIDCHAKKSGLFLSKTFDSGDKENIWHRMVMDAWVGENMAIYVSFYASDSKEQVRKVEESFRRGEDILADRMSSMSSICRLEVRNPEDILLHRVQGRYLWLGIIIWGNGTASPRIRLIQIFFPKEAWNRYLPELYQGKNQEFLERFLSIFQTIYEDMERRIRNDTSYLDLQAADGEQLLWLAKWIHVENAHLWSEEHLRQYLLEGAAWFGRRGTALGLIRMVEIFTGERPFLVEAKAAENPDTFTLLIKENVIADARAYRAVERIIREGKPADMEVRLIPLRPYLFLDQDTYLGINSQLNRYGQAILSPEASFGFAVLEGEQDEKFDIHAI